RAGCHSLRQHTRAPEEGGRAARRVLPLLLNAATGHGVMDTQGHATRLDFPVKGMHCAACVSKVERALETVPGVQRAVVNLATERATVELADEGAVIDALRGAVAAAGYSVPAEIGTTPET